MDSVVSSIIGLFTAITSRTPRFKVHGGSAAENLALQNIQVRPRWDARPLLHLGASVLTGLLRISS